MAQFILITMVGYNSGSISPADNDNSTFLYSLHRCIEKGFRPIRKSREFEHTRWAEIGELGLQRLLLVVIRSPVPEDSLRLQNCGLEEFAALGARIKAHPTIGNTVLVSRNSGLSRINNRIK